MCGNKKSKLKKPWILKSTTIKHKVNVCAILTIDTFFSKTLKGSYILQYLIFLAFSLNVRLYNSFSQLKKKV